MKRTLSCLVLLCILLTLLPLTAHAGDVGTWGDNMTWEYSDGTLTITGTGAMADCAQPLDAPWFVYQNLVKNLVFSGGVTYIGARTFTDFDSIEQITFGDALYEIGEQAFKGCDGLKEITLPDTFKIFGPECFRGCRNLTAINCLGRFPSFRLNCLWDVHVKIYYPAQRPWPIGPIQDLEAAFSGRIEFLSSDGTDPYDPNETTAPPQTQPPTQPPTTVPPTTLPPETVPATTYVPVATQPVTQPPQTQPATQPPATQPVTQPSAPTAEGEEDAKAPNNHRLLIAGSVILGLLSGGGLCMGILHLQNSRRSKNRRPRK